MGGYTTTVHLAQGTIRGAERDGVDAFHNVPYCAPHVRFEAPRPVEQRTSHHVVDATRYGPNCPQLYPTPLEVLEGPPVNDTALDNEHTCGVLSVYRPARCPEPNGNARDEEALLPVVVWVHGGAWCVGGAQTSWYDGSRLARDGRVVVVAINYRLGVFGYLYDEQQNMSLGAQDIVLAFEWVQQHCRAFGGDAANITAMGQSAGAYNVQILIDERPDLFDRAILQSSPADHAFSRREAESVRGDVVRNLPDGASLGSASACELLAAQKATQAQNRDLFVQFSPVVSLPPGGRQRKGNRKTILIGWTADDGTCIGMLGHASYGMPKWMREMTIRDLARPVTKNMFVEPNLRLAERLRDYGHDVQTFCHDWAPTGFYLGAAHCVDLPLVWGDEKAWKEAPILGNTPWTEWESRGKAYREALGRFARDGSPLTAMDGVEVNIK